MKYILLLLILFLSSCIYMSNSFQKDGCNENKKFKQQFFNCINNIEAYTSNKKNKSGKTVTLALFKQSLNELSKHVKVDYTLLANYKFGYPSKKVFLTEKQKWMNWYENNKCNNLQWE